MESLRSSSVSINYYEEYALQLEEKIWININPPLKDKNREVTN
jgi:hypothetical protein